jgi:FkbH-like protein
VLLAIISKNDEATITRIWNQLFRGLIALEDFAVRKINWESKAENFGEVLRTVNILPRSAVYIDDNPVERAVIADAYPEVRLLGADPYLFKRILLWAPETQVPFISGESARRTEMVQQQAEREQVREAMSRPQFLASLQLRMRVERIGGAGDAGFERAFELINKTNQYNSTGARWRLEEVLASFAAGGFWLTFDVEDRFSNYGVVAVALLEAEEIVQFVMSCRVVGMEVELAAISLAAAALFGAGAAKLRARIVETDANFLVRGLYQAAGFTAQDGVWVLVPEALRALPAHIEVVA